MSPLPPARLGFALMLDRDGDLPDDVLLGLKAAGYDGIEPNCYHVQHLPRVVAACQLFGLALHAIPTGRWLDPAEAADDYARYTGRALERLSQGAAIAAAVGAPLILGLIRGPDTVADAAAATFLSSVIPALLQRSPQLTILVEPIAPGEAAWPHTIEEGAQLLARLNQPRVRLLADSYHVARSGSALDLAQHRGAIGHLHIRDQRKHIPTGPAPEYAAILQLWREGQLVLSFEPNIELGSAVESAVAGVEWLRQQHG